MGRKKNNKSKLSIIVGIAVKVNKDDIFSLGSQLAYYLVLSFFPLVIAIASVIGLFKLDSKYVIDGISTIFPQGIFELGQSIVYEVVETQNTGVLGASIFITLWMASRGARAVIRGVNKAYGVKEERSYIRRTAIAYFSTIILVFMIVATLAVLVFGNLIEKYLIGMLSFENAISIIWKFLRYGIMIIILIIVLASIYKYTPSEKLKWKEVLPGAIMSALGWVIVSLGFAFYIDNFSNYSKFYGSLAAVFILMIWIYLTAVILLIGVEINFVLLKNNE